MAKKVIGYAMRPRKLGTSARALRFISELLMRPGDRDFRVWPFASFRDNVALRSLFGAKRTLTGRPGPRRRSRMTRTAHRVLDDASIAGGVPLPEVVCLACARGKWCIESD
jgi:hypothetical protein